MANSPVLWGPNNIANNLQPQVLQSTGALIAWNGPKNYITYNNFENNLTTGWSLGTVGTLTNGLPTGSPTFGSGASANLSIATTASSIGGQFSLNYVSTAATTQGNMLASQAYTIDSEDQGKVLTVKFYYSASSGASNCNFSGTSSNSFAWAVWDATNSVWLTSAGNFNIIQSSGSGYVTGTVQTGATTASIQLVIYNANATSGAATLTLDDFYLGPQTAPSGPAMADLGSNPWTPTGAFTTNTTYTGSWARTGKYFSGKVLMSFAGAPNSVSATINLPFSIDTTSMPTLTSANFGAGELTHSGTTYNIQLIYNSTTALSLIYQSAITGAQSALTQAAPVTIASGDKIELRLTDIPISGWSSNTTVSNDTDTRVVALQLAQATPSGTITGTASLVTFGSPTTFVDTHGGYSTSTGLYTVPVTGYYRCIYSARVSGSFTSSSNIVPGIAHNGSQVYSNQIESSSSFSNVVGNVVATIYCSAGDTLSPLISEGNITTPVFASGVTQNFFMVERLSGPAVVAATESVNARYTTSTSSISSSATAVKFTTKSFDSHNAYSTSTGLYTVPVSGKYQINATMQPAGTSTSTPIASLYIYINGSEWSQGMQANYSTGNATNLTPNIADIVQCNAGDTIQIYASSNISGAAANGNAFSNWFSIARVGN